ncbi:protein disulfide oxidoreductase [Algiphilus sp.]|uniref:protein disulfide oxidoreductase n=1 Tax=Algiphilus sp. TaxID=1872431 RepID=UPI003B51F14C
MSAAPRTTPTNPRLGRGPRWRRWLVDALIIVMIVAGVRLWMQRGMADGEAPEIAASTLDGTPVLLSQYADEPVLVHFWATWCAVCGLTQAGVDRLAEDRPVLTVALRSGTVEEVERHLQREGLRHPVLLDPDGAIAARFGVQGVPASFIVDTQGRIRFRNTGLTPAWELRLRMAWIDWRS